MEMGVDGMDGKCGYNLARVRERSLNLTRASEKDSFWAWGLIQKKEESFYPTAILFFGLKMKTK